MYAEPQRDFAVGVQDRTLACPSPGTRKRPQRRNQGKQVPLIFLLSCRCPSNPIPRLSTSFNICSLLGKGNGSLPFVSSDTDNRPRLILRSLLFISSRFSLASNDQGCNNCHEVVQHLSFDYPAAFDTHLTTVFSINVLIKRECLRHRSAFSYRWLLASAMLSEQRLLLITTSQTLTSLTVPLICLLETQ